MEAKRQTEENMTKKLKYIVMMVAVAILAAGQARAGGVKVIANVGVPANSISVAELKNVYLEETNSLVDGTHVQPVLEKGGPAHEIFLKEYLDRTDPALQIYYRTLIFTGKGLMPKAVLSDAEMVAFVAKTKGAIGYVSSATPAEGVKVLEVK